MRKLAIFATVLIVLMLMACGGSEKISQDSLDQFKLVDTEINELQKELAVLKELFVDQTNNETLVRLAQLQREYSVGTVKIQKGIITPEYFDVMVASLVRGHQILEPAWSNVANGQTPSQEFEILMWALFMDALEEEFKMPEEEVIESNG